MIDSKALEKLNRNLDKIGKKLMGVVKEIPNPITQELAIGANDIRNAIITSMHNTPKTGRQYKRGKGKSGKFHTASSPSEAPAVDYGELLRSIMFDVREMEVEVGNEAGAPYGKFLEESTKHIEPRPWLEPAVSEHFAGILSRVGKVSFEIMGKPFEKGL